VEEVVVFGVPDARLGEAALAFVTVEDPDVTEEAILAWAKENMASYKRPRHVRVLAELPRTHVGKTARGELRAEARRLLPDLAWERSA
jgi:long-chain acyl-CoA synthetase